MDHYTDICDSCMDDLHPYDDDYEEKLIAAASRFRPFDEALDPFLIENGYCGEADDTDSKIEFIRDRFRKAGMKPPREIGKWYEEHQDVRRKTAFMLCFAFGLGVGDTDDFFRRVFCRERSFDCHCVDEVVYYFCIRNELPFSEAERIIARIPPVTPGKIEMEAAEIYYTGTIMKAIDRIGDAEQLIRFLNENQGQFAYNNATAYKYIQRIWGELVSVDGLLHYEQKMKDEDSSKRKKGEQREVRPLDALLALLGMDKKSLAELSGGGRTLIPVLKNLPGAIRDSFPDMQGIGQILRGEHVSYERVRKWLILLSFSRFWIQKTLKNNNYNASDKDKGDCISRINNCLLDAGYMELYSANPYDWIFLYSIHDDEPMNTFRGIWNTLVVDAQDRQQTSENTDSPDDDV